MADLFEEKSKEWDKNSLVQQLSSGISKAIIDNITLDDSMKVMDFGAGTGLISTHIAPHVAKITAVDISESMLNKLIEKEHLQDKVETCCQNILDIPLTKKFDLIMSAMAMHHVKDTQELIQSFASHLNSGAQVALADLDSEDGSFHGGNDEGVHHLGFNREELQALFEDNGFKDVQFTTALTLNREGKEYPIFLLTAQKA
jgi:2-polyprenyl-3-methyl-5-hydroxy-6-metoxy-1,4-benzoquinol methylase